MDYFKRIYTVFALLSLVTLGCSSNDEESNEQLEILITNFETSYDQVKIAWELTRPDGIIIDDLLVYRIEKNDESDFYQEIQIANLPSNEKSFIDNDVPYKADVTYIVKINYRDERKNPVVLGELKSEPKKFNREIVKFDRVPFQVQKDPVHDDVFHILDQEGSGHLKKYNASQDKLTATKTFTIGSLLNNKFHFVNNNEIYIADTKGQISRINNENYQTISTYQVSISDNLNAFAVSGNRIYYQDEEIWCYYDIDTGRVTRTGNVMISDYFEHLGQNNFLFLYCQNGNNSFDIYGYSPENCKDYLTCTPTFYYFPRNPIKPNAIDANIFSWNSNKSKFITSINGCVFNISNLNQEKRLFDITGKHYFQFAFDKSDNIYATVQGEKLIHKFNSNYELVEVIKTKLYPFFPMITNDGLKVIGGYERVSYWSFEYGYSFNFNVKCAIETF